MAPNDVDEVDKEPNFHVVVDFSWQQQIDCDARNRVMLSPRLLLEEIYPSDHLQIIRRPFNKQRCCEIVPDQPTACVNRLNVVSRT